MHCRGIYLLLNDTRIFTVESFALQTVTIQYRLWSLYTTPTVQMALTQDAAAVVASHPHALLLSLVINLLGALTTLASSPGSPRNFHCPFATSSSFA
jgi:cation transport ATPase